MGKRSDTHKKTNIIQRRIQHAQLRIINSTQLIDNQKHLFDKQTTSITILMRGTISK